MKTRSDSDSKFNNQFLTYCCILRNEVHVNQSMDMGVSYQRGTLIVSHLVHIIIITTVVFCAMSGFLMLSFFVYHFRNLERNQTTIEEIILAATKKPSPFDLGSRK